MESLSDRRHFARRSGTWSYDRAPARKSCRDDFPRLDVSDQRRRRTSADVLGAKDAGLLVVPVLGSSGHRRGIILLARPVQGILTLTIVVGAYFIAEGVSTIMYALEHRRELSERWGWLLMSGIVDLVLAGLIITGLPGSAEWAIGLLVGINMLFGGASLIGMALAARKG